MKNRKYTVLVAVAVCGLIAQGCATKKYTRAEIATAEARVTERVDQQVDDLEGQIENNQMRIESNEKEIAEVSKTAQDALDRAVEAGKLAEGKLLYETVLTNADVRFDSEKAEIDDSAAGVLNGFVTRLKGENKNVYVEIQGHTDATGTDTYNEELGLERAEAVRRHLSKQGIPLHRMAVISYGESEPIADNSTKEGREQNRRVVLVVLQ